MPFGKHNSAPWIYWLVVTGLAYLWLGLLLAGIGVFSVELTSVLAVLTAAGAATLLHRFHVDTPRLPLDRFTSAAALLAVSSLFLTWPPGELLLGGWDPGVYIHTAVEVARTGSLRFAHPDLMTVPLEDNWLLIRNLGGIAEPFGGMRLLPDGRVTPQFYHAFPVLAASAFQWGGLWGALGLNTLLNVLVIFAFYLFLRVWTNRPGWALIGAFALAINPAQIWMARFCTAEMLTLLLFVTGFTFWLRWAKAPESRLTDAALGGAALGLAQLTRYDSLILLAIAIPVCWWSGTARPYRRGLIIGLIPLALAALHVTLHQRWVAPFYSPLGPLVARALLLCIIVTALAFLLRATVKGGAWVQRWQRPFMWLVTAVWISWMSVNWLLRPTLHMRTRLSEQIRAFFETVGLPDMATTLIGPNSRSMLYLETIFGPVGLALALIGVVALIWRARGPAQQAWAWGGMAVTLLLTWQPFNDLFMMWVSRRYVPVVIPWLTLAWIVLGITLQDMMVRRWPHGARWRGGVAACWLGTILLMAPASQYMAKYREWPGLLAWFETVVPHIPPDAVIYTDQAGFAAPLRFIWERQSFELHHARPERQAAFYALLERAAVREGEVYLLTRNTLPDDLRIAIMPIVEVPLSSTMIIQTRYRIPDNVRRRGGPFVIYRLTPLESP